jgi:hypothetical protein
MMNIGMEDQPKLEGMLPDGDGANRPHRDSEMAGHQLPS